MFILCRTFYSFQPIKHPSQDILLDHSIWFISFLIFGISFAHTQTHIQWPNPKKNMVCGSVADPDPNPVPDPHVFGPPGSGSISQRYGSGSFYQPAKIVRKTLIPTIFDFLSLTNDVNVPSKSNKQKIKKKN
jgi:hypothetical protein